MPSDAREIVETIFAHITKIQPLRDYEMILMELANMGRNLAKAERCTVWVVDNVRKDLWTKVAHGIEEMRISIDSGIVGDAVKNRKQMIINDVRQHSRFNADIDKQTGYTTRNMMVISMFTLKTILLEPSR